MTHKIKAGITRRTLLMSGAAAVGALSVGARPTQLMAQTPAAEQVLKVAHGGFDLDWSPMRGGGRVLRWNSLWWASPMYFDENAQIQPYVVTEWTPNDDMTEWTFTLNPDAVFSDGSPITAADIKGSWELAAMPSTRHERVNQVLAGVVGYDEITGGETSTLEGVATPDDQTVVVTLGTPDPIFFMRIANHLIPIVKASEARDENGEEVMEWFAPENGGITSGPFTMVELDVDGGSIAFEPNPNFFIEAPKLTRVEIQVIEDTVTATNLIARGDMHAHTELVTSTIIQDLGPEFSAGPQIPSGQHFWFNVNAAPFDDPMVREAAILAVDREGLIRASFPDGPHEMAEQILVGIDGVDPDWEPYPYDPERARELLAESSYGGPERLPRLILAGTTTPAITAAAQFIVEQWRQNLGITAVELRPSLDGFRPADVHIIRDDAGTRIPDAASFLNANISTEGNISKNKMNGYSNEEIDSLLDAAIDMAVDNPDRIGNAREAQRIFRDEFGFIPWYYETMSRWARAEVEGMEKNLDWQVIRPWNIQIMES
ncbi:ABC transporter substrate-binding protein [Pelagovum pacificum]|uniref:ABC transporter substrate-binding protein n=1 Tax=Pelagovum pacificum TaxID=2588711 RepID=A0A5C5G9Z6_9RHOB|nr:ABC transporter substrate-binding protein [Pelagovum pacificum]QQA42463.1 ABC transporter substrate-binding protein [Pelagovum pacificum]TNY31546.1 ABC transporter substrate-binding protein [Pelagovum pacificum]